MSKANGGHIIVPRFKEVRILADGNWVVMIKEGREILRVPWRAADNIAQALKSCARKAEEEEKALQIVEDQAIMLNAGFRLGMSNRRDILKEAHKEAANRPGGVKSGEVFGTPALIKKPPPKEKPNA